MRVIERDDNGVTVRYQTYLGYKPGDPTRYTTSVGNSSFTAGKIAAEWLSQDCVQGVRLWGVFSKKTLHLD